MALLRADNSSMLHQTPESLLFSSVFFQMLTPLSLLKLLTSSSKLDVNSFLSSMVLYFATTSSNSSCFLNFLMNSSMKNLSYFELRDLYSQSRTSSLISSLLLLTKASFPSLILLYSSCCLSISCYFLRSSCLTFSSQSSLIFSLQSLTSCFFLCFSCSSRSFCCFILGSYLYASSTSLMILALSFF